MNLDDLNKIIKEELINELDKTLIKEKYIKYIVELKRKSFKELVLYDINRLLAQPSQHGKYNDAVLKMLIKVKITLFKEECPTISILLPELIKIEGSTSAVNAIYDDGNGKIINGMIPISFSKGLKQQKILDEHEMKNFIEMELEKKIKYLLSNSIINSNEKIEKTFKLLKNLEVGD